MLQVITRVAVAAPRRTIVFAALFAVAAALFGLPVVSSLSAGGFQDPTSESAQATELLRQKFDQTDQKMLIALTAPEGVRSAPARRVATDIVDALESSPWVLNVSSAWTSPPSAAAGLVSTDAKSGLIVANLKGGENDAQRYAEELAREVVHDRDGVTVRAGGMAVAYGQITRQNEHDLLLMESLAIPLSFLVLVWVFGGLVAASLPIFLGALAIVGSMSVLRLINSVTEVSTYALDLSIALGLALAIDYTLLIISRYREEVAQSSNCDDALRRTMATAGRTVLFSATTVGASMAVMALFPIPLLRSAAYAVVATAVIVAIAAVLVTPAAIRLLGPRLDALDVRRPMRRVLFGVSSTAAKPAAGRQPAGWAFWYRSTKSVLRHAAPAGAAVVGLLLVLGAPFLGVKWGFPDERVLPESASSRQVAEMLENDFANDVGVAVSVVVPDADGLSTFDLEQYASRLSQVADVSAVTAPTGTFVAGRRVGPPAAPAGVAHGSAYLTVSSTAPVFSDASNTQLDRLHEVAGPAGRSVQLAGLAQTNRDSIDALTHRLPTVLGFIAVVTFALIFLLTGSVVLPLQALACNLLSLTAAFGAMVWIFQDGHLGALGTTPTGTLNVNIPVLLFCVAFGLSMDYEIFLISRIHEYWLASGAAPRDRAARAVNDTSTVLGLAGIGRVVTAAALLMSISFAALIPADISFMRMLGLGLTLAVLVDATLVRMVLVPAFIHLVGPWTWWSPALLARVHRRFALGETGSARVGLRRWAADAPEVPGHPAADSVAADPAERDSAAVPP